jgi:hypothetical protein
MKKFAWKMKRTGAAAMLLAISMTMAQGLGTANVWADQNLTNDVQSGATTVTGNVASSPAGSATYIISIPSTIDFGTLHQPQTNADSIVNASFTVRAVELNLTSGSAVAVLMKDSDYDKNTADDYYFRIKGSDSTNGGKILKYSVSIVKDDGTTQEIDTSAAAAFENGYPVYGFQTVGKEKSGIVSLNQNQLYNQVLNQWAGKYQGTINFYSAVVNPKDYTGTNGFYG